MIRKFSIVCLLGIFLFSVSCKKEKQDSIPNVYVDIYLYSYDPNFINLNAVGGWIYITGGVKGILVYHRSINEFMTYERNSSYQPSSGCAVEVDISNNVLLQDKCSGSEFLITDGSVTKGPASLPLKAYKNTWDGTVIHIYN